MCECLFCTMKTLCSCIKTKNGYRRSPKSNWLNFEMSKKPRLSKNLLQMKFMQRSKVEDEVEEEENLVRKTKPATMESNQFGEAKYRMELSYTILEDLVFGRMSFQGFNPEVERWMAHYAALREEAKVTKPGYAEMNKDVTDEEAALRLSNVARTIGRRFTRKRQRAELGRDEEEEYGEVRIRERGKTEWAKRFRRPE